jgi:acyl carrier protein
LDKDTVFIKIKELLVSEFELKADTVSPEKQLYDDLQLDSIDMVDLIIRLEDMLTQKIDPNLFKNACTVQDLVDLVCPFWK